VDALGSEFGIEKQEYMVDLNGQVLVRIMRYLFYFDLKNVIARCSCVSDGLARGYNNKIVGIPISRRGEVLLIRRFDMEASKLDGRPVRLAGG
jgi:hypothetical protein